MEKIDGTKSQVNIQEERKIIPEQWSIKIVI